VGVTQVGQRIWLVTFVQYDLGYFDNETIAQVLHILVGGSQGHADSLRGGLAT